MIGYSSPRRVVIAALVGGAILTAALAASASAAAPAPAWRIGSLPVPTNFKPGDESGDNSYEVVLANSGGAATDGSPIALTDTLPAGLTVTSVELPLRSSAASGEFDFGPSLCETAKTGEVEIVRCTIPEELPQTSDPTLLGPSESLRMVIHVSTSAKTSGEMLTNLAQVHGGGAVTTFVVSHNEVSSDPAPAGFSEFHAALAGIDGLSVGQAGSHPYQYTTNFALNTRATAPGAVAKFVPAGGDVKDLNVALPPGLVGNPTVTSRCTPQQFNSSHSIQMSGVAIVHNDCPNGSAVGLVVVQQLEGRGGTIPLPLYNLVPPKGMPAQFGFQVLGAPFFINTAIRTGGDYGITAGLRDTTEVSRVTAASVTIWGVPTDSSHDPLRGSCLNSSGVRFPFSLGSCPAGVAIEPFLRLPTSCANPLDTEAQFDTWTDPLTKHRETSTEPAPVNCAPLDFSPTISAQPQTTVADSSSGLRFNLRLPQNSDPNLLGEADLRDAVVTLPEGVTVNPASANGLAACSQAQVDLKGPEPARCPDASKIGSVEIHTPLLDHPVKGGVYVASQNDNPFNSLLAIYIAVDDPQSGVVVKLAGHVMPDPSTGQLTARFDDNPQLPFEDFTVEFFDGPRAALRTPGTCGNYTTATSLKPWSAPESGPDATPADSFAVSTAPGGGPCAGSVAAQPHRPAFSAGALIPFAGSFSPLVVRLARDDGSQNLRGLNVALPPGLVGRLAGVPYCPQQAIEQAEHRSNPGEGALELAAPSCPAASQVGTANVGSGSGSSPVHVQGKVYLSGPYKGAPLSLAVVTPAIAGPFDLGTVVVRAALYVDPETARVTVKSDPIPTILQGIPLDVRSIAVNTDRPDFTLNPTNCEPLAVGAEAISLGGQSALLSDRFQVGGCRGLDFAPKLSLRVFGKTNRNAKPRFRAVLQAKPGEANIARAQVNLPHSEFLEQNHIKTICTRVQWNAGAGHGAECPPASIYGHARAITPLLDQPLEGPVYLRSSSNELPDLVAALNGQIDVELAGKVDSGPNAGIRNTFEVVPDAPVSKFILEMRGGKKGLLVNSENLCSKQAKTRAIVRFTAQNGKVESFKPKVANSCGKKPAHKQAKHHH